MGIAITATFFLSMIAGAPIGFAIIFAGMLGIYLSPVGPDILPVIPQEIFRSVNSFQLLTIPLFILAGTVMAEGGIAKRLMDLAECTVGRGRGGLGAATVISTMLFHGISGSSTADTAAIARVTMPSLRVSMLPCSLCDRIIGRRRCNCYFSASDYRSNYYRRCRKHFNYRPFCRRSDTGRDQWDRPRLGGSLYQLETRLW